MKKSHFPITAFAVFAILTGCGEKNHGIESRQMQVTVFEYKPAPGQFINEQLVFDGVATESDARKLAELRINDGKFVSLGAFGGHIVVGLGESIANSGGYDFAIAGNQLVTSSEPGIVWVMPDADGNGLPDDVWYELAGSETGEEGTVRGYEVTYFRPAGDGLDVEWTDNLGVSGTVPYNAEYHSQLSYYPAWIADESYTLSGTLLESRSVKDEETGQWTNGMYEWGYADNWGNDRGIGADNKKIYFKISNAIDAVGESIHLAAIDFIKVQTGVNHNAGSLGEVSTEVTGFYIGRND